MAKMHIFLSEVDLLKSTGKSITCTLAVSQLTTI